MKIKLNNKLRTAIETYTIHKEDIMINYQTAIQAAAKVKDECYTLATGACKAGDTNAQTCLYQIIAAIQRQIEALMEMEINESKKHRTDCDLLK